MTMDWLKQQAKWIIIPFGVFIVAGLVMMDRAGSYREGRHHNFVGKVDGEEIQTDRFQSDLKNYLRGMEMQNGKAPEGLQLAQAREYLFNLKVQSILMEKIFDNYELRASQQEMMDYIVKHPQEVAGQIQRFRGYEEVPAFLADSNIDQARYENWLSQDSVYDRYSMRALEEQLRSSVVPQLQLQQILRSQVHRTLLEEEFSVAMRENKAKLKYYHVSVDSFPVNPDKYKDADLKAYYEAHPDSFYFHEDAARLSYVRVALRASKSDSNLMRDFAKELKERVANGEKFADLAKDYSNDPGTADKGGRLPGEVGRQGLDPAFANVAFNLKPGEISDPVLTQFGYHIILLHDKKKVDTTEKIEVSHILLKINPGTETVDSLMAQAEKVRESAQKNGLAAAAKEFNLTLDKTPIFDKSNLTPLGGGYVAGANSFAFSQYDAKDKISEAIQADDGIYLFERDSFFEKGRNFERAKPQIGNLLAHDEKVAAAKKELEAQKSAILSAPEGALPARLGKAMLDSTASPISADNWLAGYGYSNPALFTVFSQPQGIWGAVLSAEPGSAIAKVTEKSFLPESDLLAKAQAALTQNDPYQFQGLYQDWSANLPKSAKVVNDMDLAFRN